MPFSSRKSSGVYSARRIPDEISFGCAHWEQTLLSVRLARNRFCYPDTMSFHPPPPPPPRIPVSMMSSVNRTLTPPLPPAMMSVDWKPAARDVLKRLKVHEVGKSLYESQDVSKIPNYIAVNGRAVFLNDVKSVLDSGQFDTPDDFVEEVRLVFINFLRYYISPDPANMAERGKVYRCLDTFAKWCAESDPPLLDKNDRMNDRQLQLCRRGIESLIKQYPEELISFGRHPDDYGAPLPDYKAAVVEPMWLGQVIFKLETDRFNTVIQCTDDILLMCQNVLDYANIAYVDESLVKAATNIWRVFEGVVSMETRGTRKLLRDGSSAVDRAKGGVTATNGGGGGGVARTVPKLVLKLATGNAAAAPELSETPPPPPMVKLGSSEKRDIPNYNVQFTPDLKKRVRTVLSKLKGDVNLSTFRTALDWKAMGLMDYPQIVKRPMDLSTLLNKLDNNSYRVLGEVVADGRLIFENCRLYNAGDPVFVTLSDEGQMIFENLMAPIYNDNFAPAAGGGRHVTPIKFATTKPELTAPSAIKSSPQSQLPLDFQEPPPGRGIDIDPNTFFIQNSSTAFASVIRGVMKSSNANWFSEPVDYVHLNLPDYPIICPNLMDLSVVAKRLEGSKYLTYGDFMRDVALIWRNCRAYNREDAPTFPILTWCKQVEERLGEKIKNEILKLGRASSTSSSTAPAAAGGQKDRRKSSGQPQPMVSAYVPSTVSTGGAVNQWFCHDARDQKKFKMPNHSDFTNLIDQEDRIRKALKVFGESSGNVRKSFGFPVAFMHQSDQSFLQKYKAVNPEPMDLKTIFIKLRQHEYSDESPTMLESSVYTQGIKQFHDDVAKMLSNAERFNKDSNGGGALERMFAQLNEFWMDVFLSEFGTQEEKNQRARIREESLYGAHPPESKMNGIMRTLMSAKLPFGVHFMKPVDLRNFPDYASKIAEPRCLTMIMSNVQTNEYQKYRKFLADVRLVFSNCLTYNVDIPENANIRQAAIVMSDTFENEWAKASVGIAQQVYELKAKGEDDDEEEEEEGGGERRRQSSLSQKEVAEASDDDDDEEDYSDEETKLVRRNRGSRSRRSGGGGGGGGGNGSRTNGGGGGGGGAAAAATAPRLPRRSTPYVMSNLGTSSMDAALGEFERETETQVLARQELLRTRRLQNRKDRMELRRLQREAYLTIAQNAKSLALARAETSAKRDAANKQAKITAEAAALSVKESLVMKEQSAMDATEDRGPIAFKLEGRSHVEYSSSAVPLIFSSFERNQGAKSVDSLKLATAQEIENEPVVAELIACKAVSAKCSIPFEIPEVVGNVEQPQPAAKRVKRMGVANVLVQRLGKSAVLVTAVLRPAPELNENADVIPRGCALFPLIFNEHHVVDVTLHFNAIGSGVVSNLDLASAIKLHPLAKFVWDSQTKSYVSNPRFEMRNAVKCCTVNFLIPKDFVLRDANIEGVLLVL